MKAKPVETSFHDTRSLQLRDKKSLQSSEKLRADRTSALITPDHKPGMPVFYDTESQRLRDKRLTQQDSNPKPSSTRTNRAQYDYWKSRECDSAELEAEIEYEADLEHEQYLADEAKAQADGSHQHDGRISVRDRLYGHPDVVRRVAAFVLIVAAVVLPGHEPQF